MATTDNKILTGAGVAQLSQLVKDAIAQGGGTEYTAGQGIEISSENEISGPNYGVGGPRDASFPAVANIPRVSATSGADFVRKIKTGKLVYSETSDGIKDLGSQLGISQLYSVDINASSQTSATIGTWYYLTRYKYYILVGDTIYWSSSGVDIDLFSYLHRLQYINSPSLTATTLGGAIDELATKIPTIATTETPGTVIPDGTTITIDSNGVISSQGGGGSSYTFTSGLTESDGIVSSDLYAKFARPYNNSVGIGSFVTPNAQTNNSGWYNLVVGKSDGNYKAQPMFQCNGSQGSILFGRVAAYNANNRGIMSSNADVAGNLVGGGINSYDGIAETKATGEANIVVGYNDSGQIEAYGAGNIVVGGNYKRKGYTTGAIRAGDGSISGQQCQAFGLGVQAYGQQQMVHGRNNIIDRNSQFAEIVGNGSSDVAKSNASALDWSGNQYLTGSLYVGCTDYTTTSSGLQTANCGGQKVFYGTLTSTDTAPTVEGAINWVYK